MDDLERAILADIHRKTGLQFKKLGAISGRDSNLVSILPVFTESLDTASLPANHRLALYGLFGKPYGKPYLRRLVEWCVREDDELCRENLTFNISTQLARSDVDWIWATYPTMGANAVTCYLLASLAKHDTAVRDAILAEIVRFLGAGVRKSCRQEFQKVEHPVIQQWFAEHQVPERASFSLPIEQYNGAEPDRSHELFSAEIGSDKFRTAIGRLEKEFGFQIEQSVGIRTPLDQIPLDEWVKVGLRAAGPKRCTVFLRREDVDVIEIALIRNAG